MLLNTKQRKEFRYTKRFKIVIILINILVIALIVTSIIKSETLITSKKTTPAKKLSVSLDGNSYIVKKGNLSKIITGVGAIVPLKYYNLYFNEVSGPLNKIYVTLGSKIKTGDVIAEMLPGNLNYQIELQKLAVDKAELSVSEAEDHILDAQKSIESELVDYNRILNTSKVQPLKNSEDLKKSKLLLEQLLTQLVSTSKDKAVAEINLKNSETDAKDTSKQIAEIRLDQMDDIINEVNKSIQIAQIGISQAGRSGTEQSNQNLDDLKKVNIKLQQLKIQLQDAEKNRLMGNIDVKTSILVLNNLKAELSDCKLVSPVNGMITFVQKVSDTDHIDSGELIAKAVSKESLVLKFTTGDSLNIPPSARISVIIGAVQYKAQVYKPQPGELLDYIGNNTDLKTQVFLKLAGMPTDYKINYPMDVKLKLDSVDNAIIIPSSAIITEGSKYLVEVLQDGKATKREIRKGLETPTEVEVKQGLRAGEEILSAN